MKTKKLVFDKMKRLQSFTPVLVVGVLMLSGAVIYNFQARAATAGFYFNSSSTSYRVGDTFTVGIYENSGSQCANVVDMAFSYPTNLLRLNSVDGSGSKFNTDQPVDSAAGEKSILQFTTRKECGSGSTATSGVSGDQFIANASFTVIGTGTANLVFKDSTVAISSADNKTNVAPTRNNRTFTLANAVSPTPQPTPAPNPTPAPTPAPTPRPTTGGTTRTVTPTPVTSITPVNTDTSIPASNNDTVSVNTPVDVNPLPIQPDGINKIEYYLNGKLKATVKTSPYTYRLETEKLLNGKYTLTTKTYYLNGQSKSVSQTVVVNNPFGWSQISMRLKQFAWLIILLIILLVAGVVAFIAHRRKNGPDDYYDDGTFSSGANYGPQSPPSSFVGPTNSSQSTIEPVSSPATNGTDWQPMPVAQPSQPAQPQPIALAPNDPSATIIRPTQNPGQ